MSDDFDLPYENKKPAYNNNYSNNNKGNGGYQNYGNKKPFNKFQKRDLEPEEIVLYKPYAGTGNRNIPSDIADIIKRLTKELETLGYILRTGSVGETEEAFETDIKTIELHIPWRGFKEKESKFTFNSPLAIGLAKMFHPSYDGLPKPVQAFLCKNVRLVLGKDCKSPALFLLCWSEDGAETSSERSIKTGNVGHAIAIANALKIPVFNLGKPNADLRLKNYLGINNGD